MAGLGLSKELCVICSGDWEGQTFCGVLGNLLGALSGHAGVARVLGSSGPRVGHWDLCRRGHVLLLKTEATCQVLGYFGVNVQGEARMKVL